MSPVSAVGILLRSIAVNACLAVIKITTGLVGHSYALIADGMESINDAITSSLVLFALRISAKPPDEDHPYGHGRAEQLAALFSALSLLAAGALIAYHSIQNLFHRHTSPDWFTLPVLLLVIVVKELFSRHALKTSQATHSTALAGDAWHHRADALTSAAAFIGIVISLIGGPGYEKADDIAALLGCLVIGYNGIHLLKQALHETMDGAAPTELRETVHKIASAVPDVRHIEKLRIKKSGLGYAMDLHVQVDPSMSVDAGHRVGGAVKYALLHSPLGIHDVVVHLEPHLPAAPSGELQS